MKPKQTKKKNIKKNPFFFEHVIGRETGLKSLCDREVRSLG